MCAVVICLNSISFGIVGICMESVQMCTDPLYRLKVLPAVSVERTTTTTTASIITWTADAPVSRVLFNKLSGSPSVLLVTGSESMLWQALSDICVPKGFESTESKENNVLSFSKSCERVESRKSVEDNVGALTSS
jgi:hypothetical protein